MKTDKELEKELNDIVNKNPKKWDQEIDKMLGTKLKPRHKDAEAVYQDLADEWGCTD